MKFEIDTVTKKVRFLHSGPIKEILEIIYDYQLDDYILIISNEKETPGFTELPYDPTNPFLNKQITCNA